MGRFLDKTTLLLLGIVIILYFFSYQRNGVFPWSAAERSGGLIVDIIPKILLGFLIGGILPDVISRDVIENWLSAQSGWKGIFVGWAVGGGMPIGAPFVLYPMAVGLLKGGAGIGPVVTMLTSAALMGPFRVLIFEIPILGGEFLAIRLISAI